MIPPLLVSLFQLKDPHNALCTATLQSFHSQQPTDQNILDILTMQIINNNIYS